MLAAAAGVLASGGILLAYATAPLVPVAVLVAAGGAVLAVARPLALVGAAIAFIPLEFLALPLGGAGITTTEALFGLAGLGWAARRLGEGRSPRSGTPLDAPVVLLLLSVVPGLLLAADPAAVARVLVMWTLFALVLAAVADEGGPATVRRLLWLLAAAGATTAAISAVRSGGRPEELSALGDVAVNRAVGAFGDPNIFGTFLALALPGALALSLTGPAGRRPLALGAAGLIVAGLGLSLSRGGLLAAATALVAMLAWRPFRRVALPAAVLVVALSVAGANPLARVEQVDTVIKRVASIRYAGQSVADQRLDLYRTTPQIIADHPLFGVGENQFSAVAPRYQLIDVTTGYTFDHAHNAALTVGAELGLVGLAALLWIVVALARLVLRACSRASGDRALGIAVAAALTALAAQGLVDYTLRSNVIAALAAVLAGCAASLARPPTATK